MLLGTLGVGSKLMLIFMGMICLLIVLNDTFLSKRLGMGKIIDFIHCAPAMGRPEGMMIRIARVEEEKEILAKCFLTLSEYKRHFPRGCRSKGEAFNFYFAQERFSGRWIAYPA